MRSTGSSAGGAPPTRGMDASSSRALCEPECRQELHLNPCLRGERGVGFVWLETTGFRLLRALSGVSAEADGGRAVMGLQGVIESRNGLG